MEPAEPPPPYSPYSGSRGPSSFSFASQHHRTTLNKDAMEQFKQDLEICSHSHELLISISKTTNDLPPLTVFHHWNLAHVQSSAPALLSSSNAIPVKVGHEEFKLLQGLRDLGSFQVPATDVSSPARIHDYLTALVNPLAALDSDSEPISSVLSRLQITAPSYSLQSGLISVKFFALVVRSNSLDGLFSGGPVPVWKWFIPTDHLLPMKESSWKPDLEVLLSYPKWRPKAKLNLLLQGVSEKRAEELRRSMVLFPASDENVISHENSKTDG